MRSNLKKINFAIELLCAVQALDLHGYRTTKPLEEIRNLVRTSIDHFHNDRIVYPDMEIAREMVADGCISKIVQPYFDKKE